MYFQIICSNCGHKSRRLPFDLTKTSSELMSAGWGCCGDATYCKKCCKTWEERNRKRMPAGSKLIDGIKKVKFKNLIAEQMVNKLNREVESLQEEVKERENQFKTGWKWSTMK